MQYTRLRLTAIIISGIASIICSSLPKEAYSEDSITGRPSCLVTEEINSNEKPSKLVHSAFSTSGEIHPAINAECYLANFSNLVEPQPEIEGIAVEDDSAHRRVKNKLLEVNIPYPATTQNFKGSFSLRDSNIFVRRSESIEEEKPTPME